MEPEYYLSFGLYLVMMSGGDSLTLKIGHKH
jgi:hypothetical protein